jgi:O-antigen/teichoic acid export membrane protein
MQLSPIPKAILIASAKRNAYALYAYVGLTAILALAFSPIFLAALGPTTFGVWKTCLKFLEFATVADGRPTQALKWVIANQEGRDDPALQRQAIGSALQVWFYFLPLLLCVLFVLTFSLPYALPTADAGTLRTVGLVLGANVVLSPLLGIPDAALMGTNRGYQSLAVQAATLLLSNLAMVVAVESGYGLLTLATIVLTSTLLNATTLLFVAQRTTSWFGVQRPDSRQVKSFVGLSVWTFVWSAVEKMLLVSELLLIGVLIGPETVTSYAFTSHVGQLGGAVCLLIGSAIAPGLGKVLGGNDRATAQRVVERLRQIVLFVAICIAAAVLLLNKAFVGLWVGHSYYLGDAANALIALLLIQLAIIRSEAQVHDLGLNIGRRALLGVAATVVAFGAAAVLFVWSGEQVESLFWGVLLGRLAPAVIIPQLNDPVLGTRSNLGRQLLASAPLLGMCYILGAVMTLSSWPAFLTVALVGGAAIVTCASATLLSASSRAFVLSLAPNIKAIQLWGARG